MDRDNRTATKLYTVVGNSTAGSAGTANSTIISTATCDAGDVTTVALLLLQVMLQYDLLNHCLQEMDTLQQH
jgi:hypothetical protein